MGAFTNKIDFAVLITVEKANPNGDPLGENRPREDFNGHGEISDVCIKRKIRNRLQDMGEEIFVQSNDRCDDGFKSLSERAKGYEALQKALKAKNEEEARKAVCEKWIDVRTFGQVFAFKGDKSSFVDKINFIKAIHKPKKKRARQLAALSDDTIATMVLNFCVRNGNRCAHHVIVTRLLSLSRSLKTR